MNYSPHTEPTHFLNVYFQVHQPRRLRSFQFFDIGFSAPYFDDNLNRNILNRVAKECYLPANAMLLSLIKKNPRLKITFSISGTLLDQLLKYAPDVLESFRLLAASGSVEFLCETYYHSLSALVNKQEFIAQVKKHHRSIEQLLDVSPVIFRNTELIYSDAIGHVVSDLGYKGMYIDGVDSVLNGNTPNQLFRHPSSELVLLPRDFKLSDDISFRYSDRSWCQWPLTPKKFTGWLKKIPTDQKFVSLGMDYETLGEHHKASEGIFRFMEATLSHLASLKQFQFVTPSEALELLPANTILSAPNLISWADQAKDISAWLGNDLQRDAFNTLSKLRAKVIATGSEELISDHRCLQTSDHFYFMSTKNGMDSTVHNYFSPYQSPYDAYMNYMNVLSDLEYRINKQNEMQTGTWHVTRANQLVADGEVTDLRVKS